MLTVQKTEVLDSIYLNKEHPSFLCGLIELVTEVKKVNSSISKREVIEYLSYQPAHQFHARVIRKFKRERILSHGYNDMIQVIYFLSFFES